MPNIRFVCPMNGEAGVSYVHSEDTVERQEYGHECPHRIEALDRADAHPRCRRHEIPLVREGTR